MSVDEMMNIGTLGMTYSEREAEKSRRLSIIERINILCDAMNRAEYKIKRSAQTENVSAERRIIKTKQKELNDIKSRESAWLKKVAPHLY